MNRTYRIDDGRQTLVLAARNDRLPEAVYWGATLPEDENLDTLHAAHVIDVTGGMLDENPDLSICPEATRSFPGQPGMILRDRDGTPLLPKFCLHEARQDAGSLVLVYRDAALGLGKLQRNEVPKELALAGRVELSVTPYAHPIMPLFYDFQVAREAMPDVELPDAPDYPGGDERALAAADGEGRFSITMLQRFGMGTFGTKSTLSKTIFF